MNTQPKNPLLWTTSVVRFHKQLDIPKNWSENSSHLASLQICSHLASQNTADALPVALSLLRYLIVLEIHQENPCSHTYVFGKWRESVMSFSDEFGYPFPDTTQKLNNKQFL